MESLTVEIFKFSHLSVIALLTTSLCVIFHLRKESMALRICFYLICTIILLYLFLSLRYNYYPNLWGIKTGYIDGLGWTIFEVLKFLLISILINIIACFTLKKKSFTKKATNKIKKLLKI